MKKSQRGFTIIELLIATGVFSIIMVICLSAFLRVGQLYYKGVYLSHTQEVARGVSDDIVNQLRLNGVHTALQHATSSSNNFYFMCVGNKRYSFRSGYVVGSQPENDVNFGLVRDNFSQSLGCLPPTTSPPTNATNATELLGDKMRMVATGTGLGQSDLTNDCTIVNTRTICSVHIHIDFGDSDLLTAPTSPSTTCTGPLSGSQFCATTDMDTTVYPLQ